jgi:hypothetical protein
LTLRSRPRLATSPTPTSPLRPTTRHIDFLARPVYNSAMMVDEQGWVAPQPEMPHASSATPPAPEPSKPSLALIRDIGAVLAVAAAALYACGFVIVNTYYGRLGIPSTFVGVKCIAAALLPIGSLLLVVTVLSFLHGPPEATDLFSRANAGMAAGALTWMLVSAGTCMVWGFERTHGILTPILAGAALLGYALFVIILIRKLRARSEPGHYQMWLFAVYAFPLLIMVLLSVLGLQAVSPPASLNVAMLVAGIAAGLLWPRIRRGILPSGRIRHALITLSIIGALAMSTVYGAFVYPTVPAALGGGRPLRLDASATDYGLHDLVYCGMLPESCFVDTPSIYLIDIVGPYVLLSVKPKKGPTRTLAVLQDRIPEMVFPATPWMAEPKPAVKKRAAQPQTIAPVKPESISTENQEPR